MGDIATAEFDAAGVGKNRPRVVAEVERPQTETIGQPPSTVAGLVCLSGDGCPRAVELLGRDVTHVPARTRARMGLARTYQQSRLFSGLTVLDCGDSHLDRERWSYPLLADNLRRSLVAPACMAVLVLVIGLSALEGDAHARWVAAGFAPVLVAATFPLLRNFGKLPTNWLIDTARNTRDAAYQDFVRSVQADLEALPTIEERETPR